MMALYDSYCRSSLGVLGILRVRKTVFMLSGFELH